MDQTQMETFESKSIDITRGHEHYLSHVLMLEQSSPVALKAILKREVKRCGKDMAILLHENRVILKEQYETEYLQLFQDDKVNTNIDSWDTRQFCTVILVLFKSDLTDLEVKAIQCLYDQRKDIENYTECASLTYNIYNEKHNLLHEQLLELIKLIDDKANYDCKRMMYSIEPKSIKLNERLIGKLKHTKDFKTHLQIAVEAKLVTKNDISEEENNKKLQTISQIYFTEELQNKNVYINDSAVLRCKLNNPSGDDIEWKKDSKPVEITDNIVSMNNHCTHWLAITHASLEDMGKYSCECGNISTSADLIVTDETLNLVVDLPDKPEVIEHRNIDIECKVNLLTSKAVWRHNGNPLESSDKYVIQAKGTTHKLTVMNVTFQDEGEYTVDFGKVLSQTTLVVQGDKDLLHRTQLIEELYRNWVRGALALKYLKTGLEGFSDSAVESQHDDIMSALGGACNSCTKESLIPHKQDACPSQKKNLCLCTKNQKNKLTKMCPNGGFCGKFYDRIVCDHRFRDPLIANTDVQKWSIEPWSVATCFVNTTGYKDKQSAKEVDCSGLLSLFINNIYIVKKLGEINIDGKNDAFAQAREVRNDILHNPNYELSENQLNKYIKTFKEVLEIKDKHGNTPLKEEPGVEEALQLLDMVQKNQIEIKLEHKGRQLREHGMSRLEEKYQTAKEQYELKLKLMERQIKDKENELQLMLNLRSEETHKNVKEHFLLDLQIKVIAKNGEKSAKGNQRVYEVIRDYIKDKDDMTSSPLDERSTDTPIYHLVEYIKAVQNCHIVDVSSSDQSSTDIQINCQGSEAMEDFLKTVNCNEFQQELFNLRRWLYVQEKVESHDIIANCSSNGIEKAKQRLHFTNLARNMNCANHQNIQCTEYCPDHDTFFCAACRESKHGTCHGIKQLLSYVEQKRRLAIKSLKGGYNVRIDNTLINIDNNDQLGCMITSMCMLPKSEVLLADFFNKKLKKLNSSYTVTSYCGLPEKPYSVCYKGKDTAVVSLRNTIQYVNVSGNINLRQSVTLDHECLGLACNGDTLYICSRDTIYKYDKDCKQKQVLYQPKFYTFSFVLSDDGERLYFSTNTGLTTIDCKGNHISSQFHGYTLRDICIAGEGTVLVLDAKNNVHQLDYNGNKKHGTVNNMPLSISMLCSMCFDKKRCRLIVGVVEDKLRVYKCFVTS